MKKLFFVLILCSCTHFALAQRLLETGIKGGINMSTAQAKDIRSDWESEGFNTGVHAGLFARLNLGPLFIQPEAYYTFTQAHLQKGNTQIGTDELKLNFHRLDVPVLAGIYFGRSLRLNAGPFASLSINTNGEASDQNLDGRLQDYYNRSIWGWQAGVGLDIWRFTLDARYETTIGNLRDFKYGETTIETFLPDEQQHQQFVFSLGYKLNY